MNYDQHGTLTVQWGGKRYSWFGVPSKVKRIVQLRLKGDSPGAIFNLLKDYADPNLGEIIKERQDRINKIKKGDK